MRMFVSGFMRSLAVVTSVLAFSVLASAQSLNHSDISSTRGDSTPLPVSSPLAAASLTNPGPDARPATKNSGIQAVRIEPSASAGSASENRGANGEQSLPLAPELPCPLTVSYAALAMTPSYVGLSAPRDILPLQMPIAAFDPTDEAGTGHSLDAVTDPGQATTSSGTSAARPSLEREFFKNVLRDQRAIWTAPFHVSRDQAYWLLPLAGATAALMASDSATAEDGGEFAAVPSHQTVSDQISSVGTVYLPLAALGSLYAVGRITGDNRARETAVLAAEAALDTAIVGQGLKLIFERQRPSASDGEGEFWSKGSSFPSGHSLEAWSIATVIANEYHDHLWVEITAYSAASLVSASRFTGHHHYLSDILIGSALGFGVGRYVYRAHHYQPGGAEPGHRHILSRVRSRVAFAPVFDPAMRAYGGSLSYALR